MMQGAVAKVIAIVAMLTFIESLFLMNPTKFPLRSVSKKNLKLKFSQLFMATTEKAPLKIDSMAGGGMFTNSSPDTKRVIPTNMAGKTKFKIVYVVLESQYQSSLTKACDAINSGKEAVAVEAVGYLLEELRNPAVFEQFKADVADANIFIGSLIFVQELADKVSYTVRLL